jgi:hypothetical protein
MGGYVGSTPACYGSSLGSNPDIQHCGSGSGIRCLFDPRIISSGWEKNHDPDPGLITRIIFPRASKQFFVLKYLNSLIRDGKKGSGINIPDPQLKETKQAV